MKKHQISTPILILAVVLTSGCSPTVTNQESLGNQELMPNREEPEMKTQNTSEINVAALRSEKEAFDLGASVYICKVAKREPSPKSSRNIEFGKVTLSVVKTVRGPSRETLLLPYCFLNVPATDGVIWPPFGVGDNLICVIVPGGSDPTTVPIPGVNEAASRVVNMNKDSAEARKIEAFCQEYNAKEGK